jgi:5-methylcytosine-specific restriction endonuclease McrA
VDDYTPTKRCSKCHCDFPATDEFFSKGKRYKDGLRGQCKTCRAEYNHEYRVKNIERIINRDRDYRDKNRELTRERGRAHYYRHQEEVRRKMNARRKTEHYRIMRTAEAHRRRARKLNATGVHSRADISLIYQQQKGKCWWCGKKLNETSHVDHRIPLSRGGTNWPDNLVLTCPHCNLSKNNKMPHEWNGRLL